MCTRIPRGRDCRYDGALSNTWVGPESTNSGCLDRGEGWGVGGGGGGNNPTPWTE